MQNGLRKRVNDMDIKELNCKYTIFTPEDFLEKFPYNVGDCVVNHKYGKGDITQILCIDNEIVYEIHFKDFTEYCKANELCKYNASKGLLLQELTEYLSHATREELDKTMEEIEIALAPFKVGDKVIVKGYEKMGEDEVIYVFKTYDGDIKYKTKNHLDTHYFMEDSLTKVENSYKEKTIEESIETSFKETNKVIFETNAQCCDITNKIIQKEKAMKEDTKILIGVIPTSKGNEIIPHKDYEIKQEGDKYYLVKKKSQYPKTYEGCCEVLMGKTNFQDFELVLTKLSMNINEENSISPEPPYINLINNFYKLLICRDAYWKIAGKEMGLNKPWKPDWKNSEEKRYCIVNIEGDINLPEKILTKWILKVTNKILVFPTMEMRDTFYNNFKELIEQCKELL